MLEPSPTLVPRGRQTGPATPVIFFALRVEDEAARAAIAALVDETRAAHRLKGKAIPPDRLHVSLQGLGLDDDQMIARAMKIGAAAAAETRAFAVSFGRLLTFDTKRADKPLVLTGETRSGLRLLYAALASELKRGGLGALARPSGFTPHVTLLYDAVSVAETAIAPIGWQVTDLALVRSHVGQGRHEVLGRWVLG